MPDISRDVTDNSSPIGARHSSDSPTQNQQITIKGHIRDWMIGVLVGVCLATNIALWIKYAHTETEVRMQEYYLLELDAKLIASGLKKPEDAIAKKMADDGQAKH